VTMTATKVTRYVEGHEPLGVAVVIEGHELWMGNESYVDESDPDRVVGTFSLLGAVIDDLGKAGPPGSLGELIVYGRDVIVKAAPRPLTAPTPPPLAPHPHSHGI